MGGVGEASDGLHDFLRLTARLSSPRLAVLCQRIRRLCKQDSESCTPGFLHSESLHWQAVGELCAWVPAY